MKENIKTHILYEFKDGPWGGANQFLKAIRNYFIEQGVYADDINEADVILFNSNKFSLTNKKYIKLLFDAKYKNNAVLINRIDGPIRLTKNEKGSDVFDDIILKINKIFMDGCVFQSKWSMKKMMEIGKFDNLLTKVITNAPDDKIFYPTDHEEEKKSKTRIIATSWSANWKKGFDIYKYLDENLDFDKYEMTFVGNSPIGFNNINHIPAVSSDKLAETLREHDIYITASINDPCSNALIEALTCGLPAIGRNSGGHPEIIDEAGIVFEGKEDVIDAINNLRDNLGYYRKKIKYRKTKDVAYQYLQFCKEVYSIKHQNKIVLNKKKLKTYVSYYSLLLLINRFKLKTTIKNYLKVLSLKFAEKNAS